MRGAGPFARGRGAPFRLARAVPVVRAPGSVPNDLRARVILVKYTITRSTVRIEWTIEESPG